MTEKKKTPKVVKSEMHARTYASVNNCKPIEKLLILKNKGFYATKSQWDKLKKSIEV